MAAVESIGRAAHVERAARDADATQGLYERHSGQIFGFCVNQLGSRDEAEDAVQSTFLNAHRALQRGVTPEAELAWLFKIAHNVCLTRRRSTRRRGRVESPSDLGSVQDILPAPSRDSADDLIRLTDALAHMPDNQRRAILLREWQGLSYHEIADELELSQSAVETLIFRARRTLASNLESEPEGEESGTLSRVRKAVDVGTLLAAVKGLFEGGAAVKAAAVAVAASGAAVVATAPPAPLSKPARQKQAATSVAQAAPTRAIAPSVVFERADQGDAHITATGEGAVKLDGQSAVPTESAPAAEDATQAPFVEAPSAPEVEAPSAVVAREPERSATKGKDEPKATPPGQARKQEAVSTANGNSGKEKQKDKEKGKGANAEQPAPMQAAAPTSEPVVTAPAPVAETPAAEHGNGKDKEKDKGPKK